MKYAHTPPLYIKHPVAPHPGAWIEIVIPPMSYPVICVAPHPGAWIEIVIHYGTAQDGTGRTPPGCVD